MGPVSYAGHATLTGTIYASLWSDGRVDINTKNIITQSNGCLASAF